MKILYFSNQFASRSGHGIARFSHELFQSIKDLDSNVHLTPIAAWSDRDKASLEQLKKTTDLRLLWPGRRMTPALWAYLNYPPIESLVNGKYDALHITSLGYPISTKLPTVMTIHDIGPLSHPQYFPAKKKWIMENSIKHAVKHVDQFVAVSKASADAFSLYVKQNLSENVENRLQVIHEGVSSDFIKFNPDPNYMPINGGRPYILAAGKLSPRKNVASIIKALAAVKDKVPYDLITVGGDGWDMGQIKELGETYGIADRVYFAGYVSDQELKELYAKASIFIYPSLFEGFGLTILEAMACGAPVITSNTSSIPEVAGKAALLIDPSSVQELQEAIINIHVNKELVDQLIRAGKQRAIDLSWRSGAEQMLQVYKQLK